MLRLSAEWKCFAIKLYDKRIFINAKHFALTFLRENPAIRIRLRRGFPFFSRKVKFKQAPLLRENSTLSALAGKLARQVLAVTLAKARFCFALSIITVKLCGECAPRVFSLLFQRVTSGEAHGASARKNAVLLRFYLQYKALRRKNFYMFLYNAKWESIVYQNSWYRHIWQFLSICPL